MHDLKYKIYFYTEGEFLEMLEEIVNATSKDKSLKGKKLEKYLDTWICPYISRHLLSLNPLLACCRRYSRGER